MLVPLSFQPLPAWHAISSHENQGALKVEIVEEMRA